MARNRDREEEEQANKELRKRYQNLLSRMEKNTTIEESQLILEEANEFLEAVNRPQEALIDLKLFNKVLKKFKEETERKRGRANLFKIEEFAELFTHSSDFNKNEQSWIALGKKTQHLFRKVPPLEYLHGSVDQDAPLLTAPSPKRVKRSSAKSSNDRLVVATKYTTKEAETTKSSDRPSMKELVEDVESCLKKACKGNESNSIGFFDFVLHPSSFSESVRYMFLTSFLIKEKKASMYTKDKIPYISPKLSSRTRGGKSDHDGAGQFILRIEQQQWKDLVQALQLKEPKIKFRK